MTARILILSDLHVGSTVAVMPDEVYADKTPTADAQVYHPNAQQKVINSWYEQMLDEVGKVDALFVLGDCIEGPNTKEWGLGTWTTDINVQREAAKDLLSMVKVKPKNIFGVDGSPYHAGANPTWDGDVIRGLGGTFDTDLTLSIEGMRMHLLHWTGFSKSLAGQSTSRSGARVWAAVNADWYGKFDYLISGHVHQHAYDEDIFCKSITAPCWKLRDKWMRKQGMRGQPPQSGYYLMTLREGHEPELRKHIWVAPREYLVREVTL